MNAPAPEPRPTPTDADRQFEPGLRAALAADAAPADLADRIVAATTGQLPAPAADDDARFEATLRTALAADAPDIRPPAGLADAALGAAAADHRRRSFEAGMAEALAPNADGPLPAGLVDRVLTATRDRLTGRRPVIGRIGRRRLRQLAAAAILVMEAGVWLTIVGIADDARALNAVDAELDLAAAITGPEAAIDHEMRQFQASLADMDIAFSVSAGAADPLEIVAPEFLAESGGPSF